MKEMKTLQVDRKTSTAHRLYHYEGVCANVHGHNLDWEVTLRLREPEPPSNMTVDFKVVSDLIDLSDHALLLNKEDPLCEDRHDWSWLDGGQDFDTIGWTKYKTPVLGEVVMFDGDPTCEVLADWLAELLVTRIDSAFAASVDLAETEKYNLLQGEYRESY